MIPSFQFAFVGIKYDDGGSGGGYSDLTFVEPQTAGTPSSETTELSPEFTSAFAGNNKFIVAVHVDGANIVSVSVQGNPATLLAQPDFDEDDVQCGLYIASFSEGGGNDVEVVCDVTPMAVQVGGWTVNMSSSIPFDTSSSRDDIAPENTINIPANGFCVGISATTQASDNHAVNASFTEEDEEFSSGDGTAILVKREVVAAALAVAVTNTWDSGGSDCAACYASFAG